MTLWLASLLVWLVALPSAFLLLVAREAICARLSSPRFASLPPRRRKRVQTP